MNSQEAFPNEPEALSHLPEVVHADSAPFLQNVPSISGAPGISMEQRQPIQEHIGPGRENNSIATTIASATTLPSGLIPFSIPPTCVLPPLEGRGPAPPPSPPSVERRSSSMRDAALDWQHFSHDSVVEPSSSSQQQVASHPRRVYRAIVPKPAEDENEKGVE